MHRKIFKVLIKTKFMMLLSLTSLNAHASTHKHKATSNFKISVRIAKSNRVVEESETNTASTTQNTSVIIPNEEDEDLNIVIDQTGDGENTLISDDHGHCFETENSEHCNLQIAGNDLDLNLEFDTVHDTKETNSYEILVLEE